MKRIMFFVVSVLFCLFLFVGCNAGNSGDEDSSSESQPEQTSDEDTSESKDNSTSEPEILENSSSVKGRIACRFNISGKSTSAIYEVGEVAKGFKQISNKAFSLSKVKYSPTGKYLAYQDVTSVNGQSNVSTIIINKDNKIIFQSNRSGNYSWSPDGKTVIYGTPEGIFQAQINSEEKATESKICKKDKSAGGDIVNVAFSPNGKNIAFAYLEHRIVEENLVGEITIYNLPTANANPELQYYNCLFYWSGSCDLSVFPNLSFINDKELLFTNGWVIKKLFVETGGVIELPPPEKGIAYMNDFKISPDKQWLILKDTFNINEDIIFLTSIPEWEIKKTIKLEDLAGKATSFCWSRNSNNIALFTQEYTIEKEIGRIYTFDLKDFQSKKIFERKEIFQELQIMRLATYSHIANRIDWTY